MDDTRVGHAEEMESLRYPIGRFQARSSLSEEERRARIDELGALSGELRAVVSDLSRDKLDTPYRQGGWTVRQVIHHLADSHLNSYVRCKLAVTEDQPLITSWDEVAWAEIADARLAAIEDSLQLLDALTRRWRFFLRALEPDQFRRVFRHPELGSVTLDQALQRYAWHGRHHVAHITGLRERSGW